MRRTSCFQFGREVVFHRDGTSDGLDVGVKLFVNGFGFILVGISSATQDLVHFQRTIRRHIFGLLEATIQCTACSPLLKSERGPTLFLGRLVKTAYDRVGNGDKGGDGRSNGDGMGWEWRWRWEMRAGIRRLSPE